MNKKNMNGKFVISLDFELMWGVRDKKTIDNYGSNIIQVHNVIPRLLTTFDKYNTRATFSTVGLLFFENKTDLLTSLPKEKPLYHDKNLSPYNGYFDMLGKDFKEDLYHFAPQLINEIKKNNNHEIGTHTFSHYYCLEPGQTLAQFKTDLQTAINIAKDNGLETTSLIFPRNQFNVGYLDICKELGILVYRGNENSWLYTAKNGENESKIRRAFRLLDAYCNISGHHCYTDNMIGQKMPMNIPASRFLRPFSKKLRFFDFLKLSRIKTSMTHAAKNNLTYHLWWHPHNFGANLNENFAFLEKILKHYVNLENKYNFKSYTMTQLANKIKVGFN